MTETQARLGQFEALSFDCYGTLIDWETGLLEALEPLLARASARPTAQVALEAYAEAEGDAEAAHPAEPYPEILSRAWVALASRWGVADDPEERRRFGQSVRDWPAFPDSPGALRQLKARYQLVILSNVDRASFAESNRRLGIEFDRIITAQDLGSYKPDPRNFEALVEAVEAMGVPRGKLLHVAQSLYHDHVPAKAMGLATAWIDRRAGQQGRGATLRPKAEVRPDFTFPTLVALADSADAESA
ncbi:haloacid dehalogenase type II [Sphingomonas sp. URHD0057]|uniref:haloacid dehalogenase type II n=1 Tax=Sphingomonas sp. URHD0057 TaxID=1380389 RepID=UPI000490EFBC|nr:haloacid dehalogenase type II [Sphingomonas sp. URHD0057]